jgi:ATP-dependent Lon protease
LSTAPAADQLRQQLIGFNPTEEEFRALYRRQKAIDDAYEFEDAKDPTVAAAKAADQADMMKEFKTGLTSDRATQLAHSEDPDYQSLCDLSERFNLPSDTSDTLAAMRQAAEEQKQQLLTNKDIAPERVEVALKAIQTEMEKAARETLGDPAYDLYSPTAAWIKKLGTN